MFNLKYNKSKDVNDLTRYYVNIDDLAELLDNTEFPSALGNFIGRKIVYAIQENTDVNMPCVVIIDYKGSEGKYSDLISKSYEICKSFGIYFSNNLTVEIDYGLSWFMTLDEITSVKQFNEEYMDYLITVNSPISRHPDYVFVKDIKTIDDREKVKEILKRVGNIVLWCDLDVNLQDYSIREFNKVIKYLEDSNIEYTTLRLSEISSNKNIMSGIQIKTLIDMKELYKYICGVGGNIVIEFDIDIEIELVKMLYRVLAVYSMTTGNQLYLPKYESYFYDYLRDLSSGSYCLLADRVNRNMIDKFMVCDLSKYNSTQLFEINSVETNLDLVYFKVSELIESYYNKVESLPLSSVVISPTTYSIVSIIDYIKDNCEGCRNKYSDVYINNYNSYTDNVIEGLVLLKLIVGGLNKYVYKWQYLVDLKNIVVFEKQGIYYVGIAKVKTDVKVKVLPAGDDFYRPYECTINDINTGNLLRVNSVLGYKDLLNSVINKKFDNIDRESLKSFELQSINLSEKDINLYFYDFLRYLPEDIGAQLYVSNEVVEHVLYNNVFSRFRYRHEYSIVSVLRDYVDIEACYDNDIITPFSTVNFDINEITYKNSKLYVDRRMFNSSKVLMELFKEGE